MEVSERLKWRTMVRGALAAVMVASLSGFAAIPRVVEAAELIVDDADPALQVRGDWATSSLTSGFVGVGYRFHAAGDGSATVTWPFPSDAPAGRYEVFAQWTSGPNRASNAHYRVAHAGGTADVVQNQQVDGGGWKSLGTYELRPGQGQGVTLNDEASGVVVADAVRWVGPLAAAGTPAPAEAPPAAPSPAPAPPAAAPGGSPDPAAPWTVTFQSTPIHAGPDEESVSFGTLPQFTYLQVLAYSGEWAYVYNPRARGTGYVQSDQLGPSDPPPAYVTADAPPALETVNQAGRTVGDGALAYFPTPDPWAVVRRLGHNAPVQIQDAVKGTDDQVWYRTVDGSYLPSSAVRLPPVPPRTFSGRWIDVALSEPAILTAYEGNRVVRTTLAIHGTGPTKTPLGVFSIQRRVADETMNSETLGIPRNGPGGYFLEHVLYTQYFLPTGESIHYNYWSSNWGYAGSHGCLGLTYDDAAFLWGWASVGTPVSIHE